MVPPFEKILSDLGHVNKLDVFLRSTGGMAEVPWRIVSLLREFTDELGVIVDRLALSGATHIAISADDLVMTPFSALGSVDPTRQHPLLPKDANGNPIPTSVQDLKHLVQFVRDQLEKDQSYQPQDLTLLLTEIFKYVDPLAIGALEQSYRLSKLISKKVLMSHRNPLSDEQIKKIVDILSGEYYSHAFLISRADVESDLGLPITKPDAELSNMIRNLSEYYDAQFGKIASVAQNNQGLQIRVGAFLETSTAGWVIAQYQKENQLIGDIWTKYR
jgi:hypothetical protein